jgi:hypothetical protein
LDLIYLKYRRDLLSVLSGQAVSWPMAGLTSRIAFFTLEIGTLSQFIYT